MLPRARVPLRHLGSTLQRVRAVSCFSVPGSTPTSALSPLSPTTSIVIPHRGYHSTPYYAFAKKKKAGAKGKGKSDENEEGPEPPDVKEVEKQMESRITRLKEDFSRMHSSRVSKEMFNNVMVEAYDTKTPLPECGQVSVQTASKVLINVYDSAIVKDVAKALRECGLNLNPITDGTVVTVPIPKTSKEKREEIVKVAKKAGEKTKQEIRHIRKVAMDKIKDLKNSISEDQVRQSTAEVDAVSDKKLKAVDAEVKVKEKDIML